MLILDESHALKSGGPLLCTDRSEAESLKQGFRTAPFLQKAEEGVQEVRWTSAMHRPERSGDLEAGLQDGSASQKKEV